MNLRFCKVDYIGECEIKIVMINFICRFIFLKVLENKWKIGGNFNYLCFIL